MKVAALALILGFVNAVDQPVRHSFVVELVGREDVGNAVALNSASFNAARIVGPAVAGLLIARLGVVPAFVVNGLGFAVVLATLLRLSDDQAARPPRGASLRRDIAEGVRHVVRTPRMRVPDVLAIVLTRRDQHRKLLDLLRE